LVSPKSIADHAALQRTRSGEIIAQLTADGATALGMLRLEFVSSRALTVLGETVRVVHERRGIELALETLPLEDEPTFRLLEAGDTHGVPQFEGPNVQALSRSLRPERFQDLIAILCLARPSARANGLMQRYLNLRRDGRVADLPDARLRPILEPTLGLLLYQEQVMESATALANFDLEEAEALRRALQHRRVGELARHRARFLRGAVELGVELERAEEFFGTLLRFANFDFDKSHGVGAALMGYACAFVRAHYPLEFAASQLRESTGQGQRLRDSLADVLEHGIEVLPVDVNRSQVSFEIEGDAVRMGLECVRRLTEEDAESIVAARRAGGEFESLADFCRRLGELPQASLENLAKAGAFASLGLARSQALHLVGSMPVGLTRQAEQGSAAGQLEFDFVAALPECETMAAPAIEEFDAETLVALESEALEASLHAARTSRTETASQPVLRFPVQEGLRDATRSEDGDPPELNAERQAGSPLGWGRVAGLRKQARRTLGTPRTRRRPSRARDEGPGRSRAS
jgi:DNA polymerase-3 subunit alpha